MIHIVIIHNQVVSCTCIYYMMLCCAEKLIFAHIYSDLMSWMLPEDLEIDKHSVRHV